MKSRSFFPMAILAAGAVGSALLAADKAVAPATAPTGDVFFTRFVEASGGEAAIRQRTSRLSQGEISIPALGIRGHLQLLQTATGKTVQTLEVGPGMTFSMGSDGTVAWINIPGVGVQEMEGDQRTQFLDDSDLFRTLNLSKRFTKTEVKSPEKLAGVECDVVVGTTKAGKVETLYFSRPDGLLRRWDREILTQEGTWAPGETWIEDYRTVDGLKVPFKTRQPKPETGAYEIELSEIRHGVPTPEEKFKKPVS